MERDKFIGKLNLCYFGEKNARDEIISVYDNIILDNKKYKEVIDNIQKEINKIYVNGETINRALLLGIYENIYNVLKEVG